MPILLWLVWTSTVRRAPGPASGPPSDADTATDVRCRLASWASSGTFEFVTPVSQPLLMLTVPLQPTAVSVVSSAARCGSAMDTSRRWSSWSCRPASSSSKASRLNRARVKSRVRRSLRSVSPPADHQVPPSMRTSRGSQSGMLTICSSMVSWPWTTLLRLL